MTTSEAFDLADAPSETAFDDYATLAAEICRTPYALVTLFDATCQLVPGSAGIGLPPVPPEQSLCRIGIDDTDLLVIPDLALDPRTASHPVLAASPPVRFYAGEVLRTTAGERVGRICVLDVAPRPALAEHERAALGALARLVSHHIDLHRAARENEERARLQGALADIGQTLRDGTDVEAVAHMAGAQIGAALDVDRAGFGRVDAAAETVTFDATWTTPGSGGLNGTYRFRDFGDLRSPLVIGEALVIDDVERDPRTAADPAPMRALQIGALVNMPVRQHGRTVALLMVQSHRPRRWTLAELGFLRAIADRIEASVARLLAEQQQRALNGEIAHRLKNALAMAQAIASQTLREVPDRAAVHAFERRLLALGAAHDVLTTGLWQAADLGQIATAALANFAEADRVSIGGPPVAMGPRSAMSLSLLLHELATNAVKYGALSNATGRIDLDWAHDGGDLTVRWRETGGPPVVAPSRSGFGSRLLRLGMVGTGGVDIRFESSGVRADMVAALDQLAGS